MSVQIKRFANEQTFDAPSIVGMVFRAFPKFKGYWKFLQFAAMVFPRKWTLFSVDLTCNGRQFIIPIDVRDPYQISVFAENKHELCVPTVLSMLLRPGDFYLDVGANAGWYVRLMCEVVGSNGLVVGMEPSRRAFASLMKLCYPNLLAVPYAATRENGVLMSDMSSLLHQSATSTFVTGGAATKYSDAAVMGRSIDHLAGAFAKSPRVIKVDVEGAELDVLRGAAQTLRFVDYVMLEVNSDARCARFGYRYRDIYAFMTGHGFTFRYDVRNRDNTVYRLEPEELLEGDILFSRHEIDFGCDEGVK